VAEPVTPAGARATGGARLLVALYALFAVAATSRAAVQIATKFDEAPLAYLLSALAAAVYVVATVAISRRTPAWHRIALAACTFELLGVLVVGTLSLFDSAAFPDATVWSVYGRGYLFVPLALPVAGLVYLRRHPVPSRGRGHPGHALRESGG
jgi:cytochrome bd-type quinol oxidase subunit 2